MLSRIASKSLLEIRRRTYLFVLARAIACKYTTVEIDRYR